MVVVFVSVGVRVIVNVEALNMVESVGNVTRHRKAAIVYKVEDERGKRYVLRWVPVVSGETIAHAYQMWLSDLAKFRGLPLCEYCEHKEFVKHCQAELFGSREWEVKLKELVSSKEGYDPHEVEKTILKNCIVEDVGGFLYPGRPTPVKRTSRFSTGYMVPAMDAIERVALEPQFHVRHAPKAQQVVGQAQMPYYVEVSSAVYTLTFNLDVDGIGSTSMIRVERVIEGEELRNRVECALDALALMLDSKLFGAKLTRFNPVMEYDTVLATVSKTYPFVVSPPANVNFIKETVNRVEKFKSYFNTDIYVIGYGQVREVERVSTILELMERVKAKVVEWLA